MVSPADSSLDGWVQSSFLCNSGNGEDQISNKNIIFDGIVDDAGEISLTIAPAFSH